METKDSKAPYNFIPLNDKVVTSEKVPDFDKYHNERYTGYIDIKIETLTPLYIRDTLTEEEYRKKNKSYINPDFFSPGNLYRIPGSSLRGMIRTMIEITSFGKFLFFDDKRLYYRAVGDRSKLGIDYRDTMVDAVDGYFPKFKAGILREKNPNQYEILPSKELKELENIQIYRIDFNPGTRIVNDSNGLALKEFEFREVYFKPVKASCHNHYNTKKKPYKPKYAKLDSIRLNKDENHPNRGYIISSGYMNNKHMHWVINEPDPEHKPIEIDKEVILSYRNDKQRKALNLLEKIDELKKIGEKPEVPCFYLTDENNKIIFFGHTGFFRLPYLKTIGNHIPPEVKGPEKIDLAEAIFGNEKTHMGRVFFEDAYLDKKYQDKLLGEKTPKILSEPKPTCFQHYLEQKEENIKEHPKNLAHYNSKNLLRGYKLYWHKSGKNWEDQKNTGGNSPKDTQHTKIKPIQEGSVFNGRIRFENLSEVELGALLFALDLKKGLAHKLGMGKPLGLGSVRITPSLYISNRVQRYSDLCAEWDGLKKEEINKIDELKKAFEKYVLEKLGDKKGSLWELDRMKELQTMLDYENKPADDKTDYLTLYNFKERKILPTPTKMKQANMTRKFTRGF